MWAIMKMFNVLPTDERFRQLTEEQIEFIALMMEEDLNTSNPGNTLTGSSKEPEKYVDPDFDEFWDEYKPVEEDISDINDWEEEV